MIQSLPNFSVCLDAFKTQETMGKIDESLNVIRGSIDSKDFEASFKQLETHSPSDFILNDEGQAHFDTQVAKTLSHFNEALNSKAEENLNLLYDAMRNQTKDFDGALKKFLESMNYQMNFDRLSHAKSN